MTTHAFAPSFDIGNIFLAPSQAPAAPASEGSLAEASFAMVRNGPPVPADEVESDIDAVEITVRWGSQILAVKHLEAGKSFWVGEGTDLSLPEDLLGADRAPVVVARGAAMVAVIPAAARGSLEVAGASAQNLDELRGSGHMTPSAEVPGALELVLSRGMTLVVEMGSVRADGTTGEPITFEMGTVRAGKGIAPVGFLAALAGGATGFVGLSFLGHAAIVASLAMFMPSMADDADSTDRDQILMMQKLLNASAQRELEEQPKDETLPSADSAGGSSKGEAHAGPQGAAGTDRPVTTSGRMGMKGTDGQRQVAPMTRSEEVAQASQFGMVAIVDYGPKNAPASPWATAYAGADDKSAQGKMFTTTIDDASGTGLGLWGDGLGGGGTADVIGLDNVHTVGGGGGGPNPFGVGKGDHGGMGNGHGPGGGGHKVKTPRMTPTNFSSNGRLPAEVIQRIVRQNFGRFRLCYESGLRANPGLTGRVSTRFVIGRDGAVSQSSDSGSDLPDQAVVACVVRSFHALSFPMPDGGVATVTYPITFTPGE